MSHNLSYLKQTWTKFSSSGIGTKLHLEIYPPPLRMDFSIFLLKWNWISSVMPTSIRYVIIHPQSIPNIGSIPFKDYPTVEVSSEVLTTTIA